MISKILGSSIGAKLAERTPKIGRASGALIGATAPAILRRLSIPTMLAIAAGGYFAKKYYDQRDQADTTNRKPKERPEPANKKVASAAA